MDAYMKDTTIVGVEGLLVNGNIVFHPGGYGFDVPIYMGRQLKNKTCGYCGPGVRRDSDMFTGCESEG